VIQFRPKAKFDLPATVILISKEQMSAKAFPQIALASLRAAIIMLQKSGRFTAEARQSFPVVLKDQTFLLVGVGEEPKLSLTELRVIVRQALLSAHLKKISAIELIAFSQKDAIITAMIEGVLIGTYSWKKYRSIDKNETEKKVYLIAENKPLFRDTVLICDGVTLARDLVNDNADTITAAYFETVIRKLIKGKKHVSLEILNKKQLAAKGLNLHLAVNQASRKEPKLIIVKYNGAKSKGDYTALIGKGLTFDTGGLNIKPSGSMETMREDMSGAAAVVALSLIHISEPTRPY